MDKTPPVLWKTQLRQAVIQPSQLLALLDLEDRDFFLSDKATHQFPLRVTHSFISRMRKGDRNDPLLRQVLPLKEEERVLPHFSLDPLNEMRYNPIPGLLHKYQGRILTTVTQGCAIHCRYCFRRHFPYAANTPRRNWHEIIQYLSKDKTIEEIIFSGGDPLLVEDDYLFDLMEQLAQIAHIKTIRIHSRLPIVLPARITDRLIQLLTQTRLQAVIVLHCNHANEINEEVKNALSKLVNAHIPVFNQAVLLKGINDSVTALKSLSHALFESRVIPYYLHLLDKVQGAAHFDLDIEQAKILYQQLRYCLPGYLVPRLVRETPDERAKQPIL